MGRIWYFVSFCLWIISWLSILHGHSAGVINRTKTLWTQLDTVTKEQNGNYTCLVKNQSGENGSRTIELEMKGETFYISSVYAALWWSLPLYRRVWLSAALRGAGDRLQLPLLPDHPCLQWCQHYLHNDNQELWQEAVSLVNFFKGYIITTD